MVMISPRRAGLLRLTRVPAASVCVMAPGPLPSMLIVKMPGETVSSGTVTLLRPFPVILRTDGEENSAGGEWRAVAGWKLVTRAQQDRVSGHKRAHPAVNLRIRSESSWGSTGLLTWAL